MHKFITFIKEFRFPKKSEIFKSVKSFSKKELAIFISISLIALVSFFVVLAKINNHILVKIPANGGTITEGVIGTPTLVNPVLAISDADKDLTALVYSGLMRKNQNGEYIPDIAKSYDMSSDGKTYTFYLKDNITFHDGYKLNADDVIFTIEKIKDPLIKSPRKTNWDAIEVKKIDDLTVSFTLKEPYISFMDNTTLGIIPSHIWKNITPQEFSLSKYNLKAIGSGPYKIISVQKDKEGVPEKYKLKYFNKFSLGSPHIKYINIKSYSNEKELIKALESGNIDLAGGISPNNIKISNYDTSTSILSRTFGLFLNENKNKIFSDQVVIKALEKAINKEEMIKEILGGYGTPINNPVPNSFVNDYNYYKNNYNPEEAISILEKDGWKRGEDGIMIKGGVKTVEKTKKVGKKTVIQKVKVNEGTPTRLSFSITTGDTPELKMAVSMIKDYLSKIGVEVNIDKVYETGQLSQTIRARDYEALYFGQIINHESDLYSFWHSSQRGDPGLNIAMANNKDYDSILDSIQKTLDIKNRTPKYKNFVEEFEENPEAIMIFSPTYIYVNSKTINNKLINTLNNPSDRFNLVYDWYAKEDLVWKIFAK